METWFSMVGQILPFVMVITTLVFVHELGHYSVARYYGVRVEAFSIGMGPELLGWTDRHHTRWKVCLFPIGGYVKFLGDADGSSRPDVQALAALSSQERSGAYMSKPPGQRIAIACAGPLANYGLALGLFWGLYAVVGQKYTAPIVEHFATDSPAYAAGIQKGDRILSIDDHGVERFEDISGLLKQKHTAEPVQVRVERSEGDILSFSVTPHVREMKDIFGDVHKAVFLGIGGQTTRYQDLNIVQAFQAAGRDVVALTVGNLKGLWDIITGVRSTDEMGGPIRIAQMSSQIFKLDHWAPFLWFLGTLSVMLGLINLFPIPMLDGGHVALFAFEKIRGRPLSEKAQEYAFRVGFALVGSLMVLSFWNDLQRLTFVQNIKTWMLGFFS